MGEAKTVAPESECRSPSARSNGRSNDDSVAADAQLC
jgi:hypothetical protein